MCVYTVTAYLVILYKHMVSGIWWYFWCRVPWVFALPGALGFLCVWVWVRARVPFFSLSPLSFTVRLLAPLFILSFGPFQSRGMSPLREEDFGFIVTNKNYNMQRQLPVATIVGCSSEGNASSPKGHRRTTSKLTTPYERDVRNQKYYRYTPLCFHVLLG